MNRSHRRRRGPRAPTPVQRDPLTARLVKALKQHLNPAEGLLPDGSPEKERHDQAIAAIREAETSPKYPEQ